MHPSTPGPTCTGVVLAGGRASRFGGDPKGLARFADARIIDHVAGALAAVTDTLLLIAHAPDAARWLPGVSVAGDVYHDCGALGGLHAALAHARGTDVLVVAWDMPFVTAPMLRMLLDARRGTAAAVVPVHPDGHDEPLCAFYGAGCAGVAERLLQRGERRAGALADAVDAVRVAPDSLARLGDPRTLLASVNTPAELAHAHALLVERSDQRPRS